MSDIRMTALENLHIFSPDDVSGYFDIPKVHGVRKLPDIEWTTFNYARSMDGYHKDKGVMFYLNDYQFSAVWNQPQKYVPLLRCFGAVMAPDFSYYTDMPKALQFYNHYRRMWCAAYWQANGIKVVPCICWSNESSFEWCFDGQPTESIVSVSTVGTQRYAESMELFRNGYEKMIEILRPSKVLVYGRILDFMGDEAVGIGCFTDKFKKG